MSLVLSWRVPRDSCLTVILLLQVRTEHLIEPCPVLVGTVGPLSYLHHAITGASEHLTEPCPLLTGTMGPLSYLHPTVTDACRAFN